MSHDSTYILEKYRPKKLSDFVGHSEEIKRAQEWMDMFKSKTLPKNKKGLLFAAGGFGGTSTGNGSTGLMDSMNGLHLLV